MNVDAYMAAIDEVRAERDRYREVLEEIVNHTRAVERGSLCDEHCADEMIRIARDALDNKQEGHDG